MILGVNMRTMGVTTDWLVYLNHIQMANIPSLLPAEV